MDEIKTDFRPAVFPADILDDENLNTNERLIMIVLFSYTNAHTNTAFPSYGTLAKKTKLHRSTVIDYVNKLVEKGYIEKQEQFKKVNNSITNTSNLYSLHYKRTQSEKSTGVVYEVDGPSRRGRPGVVGEDDPGSRRGRPELSIELSNLNMIDCLNGASAETAAADESTSESHEIFEALKKNVPGNCYVADNIPFGEDHIKQAFLMIMNQFPFQQSPEVVKIACELYNEKVCNNTLSGVVMKMDVQNPIGMFQRCYKDAIKVFKLVYRGYNAALRKEPNRLTGVGINKEKGGKEDV